MSFLRYPKYKDSGVGWLGEVPEHWQMVRISRIASINDEVLDEDTEPEYELQYVDISSLNTASATLKPEPMLFKSSPSRARRKVRDGDVLVSTVRTYLRAIAPVIAPPPNMIVSTGFAVVRPQPGFCPSFARYALLASSFIEEVIARSTGVSYPAISAHDLGTLQIPRPTTENEQLAIANFLGRETAKIDALVEEQRRLIELLKEKRQAVISHAVTKGLDPNAPMKDSGIEWLGNVPENWQVRRIGSVSTKITNGFVGPTRDIYVPDGIRYLQSLHIKEKRIVADNAYFVSKEWSNARSKSILAEGDVLVVQTGDIGQSAVVTKEFVGSNCHALIIIAPDKDCLEGEWLSVLLSSDYGFQTLLSIQTGALHPHLNCGDVKDVFCPVPDLLEQRNIVAWLRERRDEFGNLIYQAEGSIALLQERRSALISAAVTGKIDVRGLAPRDPS